MASISSIPLYPATGRGTSEELFGQTKAVEQGFTIHTKILVGGPGSLAKDKIFERFAASLIRLGEKVDTLYTHTDSSTPLLEQAEAFDALYRQDKFEHLGVSNWPVGMVKEMLAICKEKGFVAPSVYQSRHNPIAQCRWRWY